MYVLSINMIRMANVEKYLIMCKAANEIQKPTYYKKISRCYCPNLSRYYTETELYLAEKVLLPTLEDLIDIYTDECEYNMTDTTTLLLFAAYITEKSKDDDFFAMFPMKEMVALCFVIEKLFKKVWKGNYDTKMRLLSGEWVK